MHTGACGVLCFVLHELVLVQCVHFQYTEMLSLCAGAATCMYLLLHSNKIILTFQCLLVWPFVTPVPASLPVPPCPPQILMRHAVEDVKRLSLEMGGNAPLIVFDSANIKLAVAGTLAGKVRCSGQVGVASLYSESV